MITFLYDTEDNLITDLVNTAILNPEAIHIKNKLLDGSNHIQTIGEPSTVIDIICYVNEVNKAKIDLMYCNGEPLKLIKKDKWYKGLITQFGKSKVFAIGELYEMNFKISVSSEGVI